jgi:hypothetical protein
MQTRSGIIAVVETREEYDREAAWRIAVEQWLVKTATSASLKTPKCHPIFARNSLIIGLVAQAHNPTLDDECLRQSKGRAAFGTGRKGGESADSRREVCCRYARHGGRGRKL